MKISDNMQKILTIALAVSGLMLAGSCSVLNKTSNAIKGSDGNVTTEQPAKKLTPPKGSVLNNGSQAQPSKKADQSQTGDNLRESVTDSQTIPGTEPSKAPAELTTANTLPADFTINGEWTIYSVRGNLVKGEERPYIDFDLAAKRFYGSNGCNIINGDINAGANKAIKLENIISTMKMCHDDEYSYLINLALSDVDRYTARQEGSITFLDLQNTQGQTLIVLRRHNMDFLNGAWRVDTLNGTALTEENEATLVVNIPDKLVHGNTGCNIYNGHLFIDPDKRRSIQFADLATTRMMCAPDSRETEFLLALEAVETGKLTGKDTAVLYDQQGNELFTLTRIEIPKD